MCVYGIKNIETEEKKSIHSIWNKVENQEFTVILLLFIRMNNTTQQIPVCIGMRLS